MGPVKEQKLGQMWLIKVCTYIPSGWATIPELHKHTITYVAVVSLNLKNIVWTVHLCLIPALVKHYTLNFCNIEPQPWKWIKKTNKNLPYRWSWFIKLSQCILEGWTMIASSLLTISIFHNSLIFNSNDDKCQHGVLKWRIG